MHYIYSTYYEVHWHKNLPDHVKAVLSTMLLAPLLKKKPIVILKVAVLNDGTVNVIDMYPVAHQELIKVNFRPYLLTVDYVRNNVFGRARLRFDAFVIKRYEPALDKWKSVTDANTWPSTLKLMAALSKKNISLPKEKRRIFKIARVSKHYKDRDVELSPYLHQESSPLMNMVINK